MFSCRRCHNPIQSSFGEVHAVFHGPCGRMLCDKCPREHDFCPTNALDQWFSVNQNPQMVQMFTTYSILQTMKTAFSPLTPLETAQRENRLLQDQVDELRQRLLALEQPRSPQVMFSEAMEQLKLPVTREKQDELKLSVRIPEVQAELKLPTIIEEEEKPVQEELLDWSGGLNMVKMILGKRTVRFMDNIDGDMKVADLKRRAYRFYHHKAASNADLAHIVLSHNNKVLDPNEKSLLDCGVKHKDDIEYEDAVNGKKRKVEEIFNVKTILGHRTRGDAYEYRVEWENYGPEWNTWEPKECFNHKFLADYWSTAPVNLENHPV